MKQFRSRFDSPRCHRARKHVAAPTEGAAFCTVSVPTPVDAMAVEWIKAAKKADMKAKKRVLRTEDMANGVFILVGSLPKAELQKGKLLPYNGQIKNTMIKINCLIIMLSAKNRER